MNLHVTELSLDAQLALIASNNHQKIMTYASDVGFYATAMVALVNRGNHEEILEAVQWSGFSDDVLNALLNRGNSEEITRCFCSHLLTKEQAITVIKHGLHEAIRPLVIQLTEKEVVAALLERNRLDEIMLFMSTYSEWQELKGKLTSLKITLPEAGVLHFVAVWLLSDEVYEAIFNGKNKEYIQTYMDWFACCAQNAVSLPKGAENKLSAMRNHLNECV